MAQGGQGCLWPDTLPSTESERVSLRATSGATACYVRDLGPLTGSPRGLQSSSCKWRLKNSTRIAVVERASARCLAHRKCLISVSGHYHGSGLLKGFPPASGRSQHIQSKVKDRFVNRKRF